MTGWLTLTNEQRKATIDQAEQLSGISAKVIEKDWWVTLTLNALFSSIYSRYIVFKGGTSLSKCWKLIARFSEDIDIALSPEAFGKRSSLSFIPPEDIIDVYRQDYSRMQEQMIYGNTLSFDDLIDQLKKLQDDFRKNQ